MDVKRTIWLGVGVGLLALAFVALPAAASAAQWTEGGVPLGGKAEEVEVLTEGKLKLEAGPKPNCVVSDRGFVWNEGGVGQVEVTEFVIHVPCETSVPGCTVTAAPVTGLPWKGASTAGGLKINGVGFSNTFSAGCGELSGQTISASGSLEAPYNNETGCMEFNKSPGLVINGVLPASLTGRDCIVAPEGLALE